MGILVWRQLQVDHVWLGQIYFIARLITPENGWDHSQTFTQGNNSIRINYFSCGNIIVLFKILTFLNFKSYYLPDHKIIEKEKFVQNLAKWELKHSPRAENLETIINIYKKVIAGE